MQFRHPIEANSIPNDRNRLDRRWVRLESPRRLLRHFRVAKSRVLHQDFVTMPETQMCFQWNVAIRGYTESENPKEAVLLYKGMLQSGGSRPDNYTYPLLFKACARLSLIDLGHEILGHVLKLGFDLDIFVHNAVIYMLVSCGELEMAQKDNWNLLNLYLVFLISGITFSLTLNLAVEIELSGDAVA
ncbi:hypothetical protein L1049_017866 [Liquidambar formosana]|uniref:Pentatricopeptide repeat-containing protein n=1 Tax=Liquidambar formosana TaxID=63359 RepID=A0AAP0R8T1_LIQFO